MRHIKVLSLLQKAEIETTLSVGQILTLIANILSVIAQAFVAKEEGTSSS